MSAGASVAIRGPMHRLESLPPPMVWPPRVEEPVWDQSVSLDESDFDEVFDVDVDPHVYADADGDADLVATSQVPIYEPVDPSALYYMVAPGDEPGAIILRALPYT